MARWIRLLGALFALTLVLAACGGDDGGDDGSGGGAEESSADTAADGGDGSSEDLPCDGDVCLSGILFTPDAIEVAAGTTVTWTSVDSPDHTVTADDGAFDSGTIGNGDSFDFTFESSGEFTYHCEIHPSMTGTVSVS